MFTTVESLLKGWEGESKITQNVMNALTEAAAKQEVAEGHRNLARVAWHIAISIPEMMSRAGLDFSGIDPEAPVPASVEEIKKVYAEVSARLLEEVKAKWNDDTLQQEDEMYGETWKKGLTTRILINHEIHHRGQMSVLMRQAGLVVPSIYGPAKEGWAEYGAPPPAV